MKLSDKNSNLVCESDEVGLESTELLLVLRFFCTLFVLDFMVVLPGDFEV